MKKYILILTTSIILIACTNSNTIEGLNNTNNNKPDYSNSDNGLNDSIDENTSNSENENNDEEVENIDIGNIIEPSNRKVTADNYGLGGVYRKELISNEPEEKWNQQVSNPKGFSMNQQGGFFLDNYNDFINVYASPKNTGIKFIGNLYGEKVLLYNDNTYTWNALPIVFSLFDEKANNEITIIPHSYYHIIKKNTPIYCEKRNNSNFCHFKLYLSRFNLMDNWIKSGGYQHSTSMPPIFFLLKNTIELKNSSINFKIDVIRGPQNKYLKTMLPIIYKNYEHYYKTKNDIYTNIVIRMINKYKHDKQIRSIYNNEYINFAGFVYTSKFVAEEDFGTRYDNIEYISKNLHVSEYNISFEANNEEINNLKNGAPIDFEFEFHERHFLRLLYNNFIFK